MNLGAYGRLEGRVAELEDAAHEYAALLTALAAMVELSGSESPEDRLPDSAVEELRTRISELKELLP